MNRGMLLTGLQIGTSLGRLAGFSFAVLTYDTVGGNATLLLVIGFLPYLAFFDTFVQSMSRARYLYSSASAAQADRWRSRYARGAFLLVALCLTASMAWSPARYLLVAGTWPLGAIGYVWERWIAQRRHQLLLAGTELALLGSAVGGYLVGAAAWPVLLVCVISAPAARLAVLALPQRFGTTVEIGATSVTDASLPSDEVPPARPWHLGRYIGTSLAQQLVGASAASLPAVYAQITGDWRHLSINIAVFRSLHSLAAVASLAINAMSSRIFYQQAGAGFDTFEARILDFSRTILAGTVGLALAAALVTLLLPGRPAAFSFVILPIMATVNVESSLLYNRGLPTGTLHCQILIFVLSLSFLLVLVNRQGAALAVLAVFAGYVLTMIPPVLRAHRNTLRQQSA